MARPARDQPGGDPTESAFGTDDHAGRTPTAATRRQRSRLASGLTGRRPALLELDGRTRRALPEPSAAWPRPEEPGPASAARTGADGPVQGQRTVVADSGCWSRPRAGLAGGGTPRASRRRQELLTGSRVRGAGQDGGGQHGGGDGTGGGRPGQLLHHHGQLHQAGSPGPRTPRDVDPEPEPGRASHPAQKGGRVSVSASSRAREPPVGSGSRSQAAHRPPQALLAFPDPDRHFPFHLVSRAPDAEKRPAKGEQVMPPVTVRQPTTAVRSPGRPAGLRFKRNRCALGDVIRWSMDQTCQPFRPRMTTPARTISGVQAFLAWPRSPDR